MTLNDRLDMLRERHRALLAGHNFRKPTVEATRATTRGADEAAKGMGAAPPGGGPASGSASPPSSPLWKHRRKKTDRTQSARALRYQQRNLANGLCRMCPEPRVTSYYCAGHAAHLSDWERRKKGKTGPARVYRCTGCHEPGHTRVSCERRKLVAARSQAPGAIAQQRTGDAL